jgi:hypothetical protein
LVACSLPSPLHAAPSRLVFAFALPPLSNLSPTPLCFQVSPFLRINMLAIANTSPSRQTPVAGKKRRLFGSDLTLIDNGRVTLTDNGRVFNCDGCSQAYHFILLKLENRDTNLDLTLDRFRFWFRCSLRVGFGLRNVQPPFPSRLPSTKSWSSLPSPLHAAPSRLASPRFWFRPTSSVQLLSVFEFPHFCINVLAIANTSPNLSVYCQSLVPRCVSIQ